MQYDYNTHGKKLSPTVLLVSLVDYVVALGSLMPGLTITRL